MSATLRIPISEAEMTINERVVSLTSPGLPEFRKLSKSIVDMFQDFVDMTVFSDYQPNPDLNIANDFIDRYGFLDIKLVEWSANDKGLSREGVMD